VLLLTVVNLAACAHLSALDSAPQEPQQYLTMQSTLTAPSGCSYLSIHRKPAVARVPFTVVLGHGFLRTQQHLRHLSESIAAAGIAVITVDFCAMQIWNGQHLINADAMREAALHHGAEQVVFAGHSAGALAALVAARDYQNSVGVLLLDFVDDPPIGVQALRGIELPVTALFGAPSACNAQGRDFDLITRIDHALVEQFDNASHCAFESPTDYLCVWLCGNGSTDNVVQRRIIERAVQALFAFAARPYQGSDIERSPPAAIATACYSSNDKSHCHSFHHRLLL
jgi:pimeloyl-ACP methyl ester carboxylesterase